MNVNQHSGPGPPMKSYAANALNTTLAPSIAIKTCDSSNHFSKLNEIGYKKVAITAFMNTKAGSSTSSMSSPSPLSILSSSCSLSSPSCIPSINGNPASKSVCEGASMTSATMNINNISSSSNGNGSDSSNIGGKITNGFIAPPPLPPAVGCTTSSDRLVTGPSCKALRTAVSALYSVDDFVKEKIGSGFFSEVYKINEWSPCMKIMILTGNKISGGGVNMWKTNYVKMKNRCLSVTIN
uniref:Protein kinase domain-containing protein n=1 Tax=Glossina austeni TaxID=7395 RepID=A0A1A9VR24_GLOAU